MRYQWGLAPGHTYTWKNTPPEGFFAKLEDIAVIETPLPVVVTDHQIQEATSTFIHETGYASDNEYSDQDGESEEDSDSEWEHLDDEEVMRYDEMYNWDSKLDSL